MCGICGFAVKRKITLDELKAMNDTMYHRGPDDNGEEIFDACEGYQIGFAHRRLSILDLSELGHQPMHSKDSRISVIFNGEIYNFQELKEQLSDYEFQSNCDTEIIIASYLKWGIDCITRLQGMFAIALYDREIDELFLIRDRIGKKPLYYWLEGENLVFASELKPIMKCPGFPKRIRQEIVSRYLYQQYIASPESIFDQVYKLQPGAILRFKNGKVNVTKYWDVAKVYHEKKLEQVTDYAEAKAELTQKLENSVKRRMISDVPLGSFLSGGYDSSLVTAIAQEISEKPLKTFTIGFYDEQYNEAGFAKDVASYLGTEHTELYIEENEMLRLVESIPKYYDEPFADSSQIPSMLVSELAKQQVTVALSGDGGDEFFCGYNIYRRLETVRKLDYLGKMIYDIGCLPGIKKLDFLDHLPLKVRAIVNNRDDNTKTQVGSDDYMNLVKNLVLGEQLPCKYYSEQHYQENNWQERRMLLDMDTYLPDDILCKVDRAGMKYSLETRCPILDTDIMEYAYKLPHSFKSSHGIMKHILKDIAYEYIPKELLERPKKGFSVPIDKWLRGALKEELLDLSSGEFLERENIFDKKAVQMFIGKYLEKGDAGAGSGKNYSRIVWAYYNFQKWYDTYM